VREQETLVAFKGSQDYFFALTLEPKQHHCDIEHATGMLIKQNQVAMLLLWSLLTFNCQQYPLTLEKSEREIKTRKNEREQKK
jgi:hypothetical protein